MNISFPLSNSYIELKGSVKIEKEDINLTIIDDVTSNEIFHKNNSFQWEINEFNLPIDHKEDGGIVSKNTFTLKIIDNNSQEVQYIKNLKFIVKKVPFVPIYHEYRPVEPWHFPLPPIGLDIKMDMDSGLNYAKIPDEWKWTVKFKSVLHNNNIEIFDLYVKANQCIYSLLEDFKNTTKVGAYYTLHPACIVYSPTQVTLNPMTPLKDLPDVFINRNLYELRV